MSLAEKLVSLRKQKGLTQMELAEDLHVSRQAISRWEVGVAVPSTDNLKTLSELYEVSLDYLLSDSMKITKKENETQEPKNNNIKFERRKLEISIVAMITLLVVLVIFVLAQIVPDQKEKQVVPMEDMTVVEENNSPTVMITIE